MTSLTDTPNINRPEISGNDNTTLPIGSTSDVTTLRPDPSPRIGTDTEIFVNGTEVFPAYTVFGEPCKGNNIPNGVTQREEKFHVQFTTITVITNSRLQQKDFHGPIEFAISEFGCNLYMLR